MFKRGMAQLLLRTTLAGSGREEIRMKYNGVSATLAVPAALLLAFAANAQAPPRPQVPAAECIRRPPLKQPQHIIRIDRRARSHAAECFAWH